MILSSSFRISCILYLLCFKKDKDASETLKRYGGNVTVANSRESSTATGDSGLSAGVPVWTVNLPFLVKNILSILPR